MSVEISNLSKSYGEKKLFRDFSLTIQEPMVLCAPSGAGKTTLLHILMGLELPDSGMVRGVGRVGAVFQEDRLCPGFTAMQNVALAAKLDSNQICAAFARLGMTGTELRIPAARLSGGQKRRVALLRALLAPSDTILLDEPFTGLDEETKERAAAFVKECCTEKPALIALHDTEVVKMLGWPVVNL